MLKIVSAAAIIACLVNPARSAIVAKYCIITYVGSGEPAQIWTIPADSVGLDMCEGIFYSVAPQWKLPHPPFNLAGKVTIEIGFGCLVDDPPSYATNMFTLNEDPAAKVPKDLMWSRVGNDDHAAKECAQNF